MSNNFIASSRFACICKDYCGVLNENSIQQNFVLIYEILDEVLVSKTEDFTKFSMVDCFDYLQHKLFF
jgi:hypothetical protein